MTASRRKEDERKTLTLPLEKGTWFPNAREDERRREWDNENKEKDQKMTDGSWEGQRLHTKQEQERKTEIYTAAEGRGQEERVSLTQTDIFTPYQWRVDLREDRQTDGAVIGHGSHPEDI